MSSGVAGFTGVLPPLRGLLPTPASASGWHIRRLDGHSAKHGFHPWALDSLVCQMLLEMRVGRNIPAPHRREKGNCFV